MSTSTEIIEDAFTELGVNSTVSTVDAALVTAGFTKWKSILADFIKKEIILAETDPITDITTTIAVPTTIGQELNEPPASRHHLVNYLAMHLLGMARVDPATLKLPPLVYTLNEIEKSWKVHVIPRKTLSSLLPRGQGGNKTRTNDAFFDGQTIKDDVESDI